MSVRRRATEMNGGSSNPPSVAVIIIVEQPRLLKIGAAGHTKKVNRFGKLR